MQQPAAASPANRTGGFANVLAALAAPAEKARSEWNDDGLADDITTLSYEQALRTHARYRPASELPPIENAVDGQLFSKQTVAAELSSTRNENVPQAPATEGRRFKNVDESRKAASITIRLSKAECAQLHERAAEAGLTVSAYLRSCTCEVEALRAQVKEALAQLRPADAGDEQRPGRTEPGAKRRFWSGLGLPWGHRASDRV